MKEKDIIGIRLPKGSGLTPEQHKRIADSRIASRKPKYMKPGVYTRTISGHPSVIDGKVNAFHQSMAAAYNAYTVIATATYPMPDGLSFYITYSIGTPKAGL